MKKLPIVYTLSLFSLVISLQACHNGASNNGSADSTASASPATPNPSQDGASKLDSSNISGPVAVSKTDEAFIMTAADGGMTEVQASQVAQSQAANPRVKQFASMMVTDHTKAGDQLKSLAQSKNVPVPPGISDEHRKAVSSLQQKTGNDFDKAYMKMMVKDHEETVHDFEKGGDEAQDSSLKQFITATLPTLRMHLDSAKAIEKTL